MDNYKIDPKAYTEAIKFIIGSNQHVCRLCLSPTNSEEMSFEQTLELDTAFYIIQITLQDLLYELGMASEPQLPQVLCTNCTNIAINCYLFNKLSSYSNQIWSDVIQSTETNTKGYKDIHPNIRTTYIVMNDAENHLVPTRKKCKSNDKIEALRVFKELVRRKKHYKETKKDIVYIVCEGCGAKIFKSLFKQHVTTCKKAKGYSCEKCSKKFSNPLLVKEHIKRVHDPRNVKCPLCDKKFSHRSLLIYHERYAHTPVDCKVCAQVVSSRADMRKHLDSHFKGSCQYCNKNFRTLGALTQHQKICPVRIESRPSYFCDICGKSYLIKTSLISHLKVDHGFGKVVHCNWCGKKFDAVCKMKMHILKHTRERNFTCEQCGNKFVTQAALTYHTRLHTGEKPFPCEHCDERFLSASRRMEHMRRKHIGRTFPCKICGAKFLTGYAQRNHQSRHLNPKSKLYLPGNEP